MGKRAFVKEVFQDRETMGVGNVRIEGSDINSHQMVLRGGMHGGETE